MCAIGRVRWGAFSLWHLTSLCCYSDLSVCNWLHIPISQKETIAASKLHYRRCVVPNAKDHKRDAVCVRQTPVRCIFNCRSIQKARSCQYKSTGTTRRQGCRKETKDCGLFKPKSINVGMKFIFWVVVNVIKLKNERRHCRV